MNDAPYVMSPWKLKLLQERDDLRTKHTEIKWYVGRSPHFQTLSVEEREELQEQYEAMDKYLTILETRIARSNGAAT